MKSPKYKYLNDPEYHNLVDTLTNFIERTRFTPSQMQEAVLFAYINYEMRRMREMTIDPRASESFRTLDECTTRNQKRQ